MIIVSDFIQFISTHNDELLEQKSEEKSDSSRIFFIFTKKNQDAKCQELSGSEAAWLV